MKPNEIQKEVCKLIKQQASFWANSNDIDSPTHLNDIEESVEQLGVEDIDKEELVDKLNDLYWFVKSLKYYETKERNN